MLHLPHHGCNMSKERENETKKTATNSYTLIPFLWQLA